MLKLLTRMLFCLSLAYLGIAQAQSQATPLKVFFIGNSLTYQNSLPNTLVTVAASSVTPRDVTVKESTMARAALSQLVDMRATKAALAEEKWDYVVLQEQRTIPARSPDEMYQSVRKITADIAKAGAKPVLYLTWADRGDSEMQAKLSLAYVTLAREVGAKVVPVGPAWQFALSMDPKLPLHASDGYHPTPMGTYLAACVFYHVLLGATDPCPAAGSSEATPAQLATLRAAAAKAAALTLDEISPSK